MLWSTKQIPASSQGLEDNAIGQGRETRASQGGAASELEGPRKNLKPSGAQRMKGGAPNSGAKKWTHSLVFAPVLHFAFLHSFSACRSSLPVVVGAATLRRRTTGLAQSSAERAKTARGAACSLQPPSRRRVEARLEFLLAAGLTSALEVDLGFKTHKQAPGPGQAPNLSKGSFLRSLEEQIRNLEKNAGI